MQKDTLVLWAKYNKVVNEKMNDVIKTLSPEEWVKDLGGYFKTVRGICSHIYLCDFNYLKRFSSFKDFAVFKDAFFNRELYSNSELLFNGMGEYFEKRPVMDDKITAFIDELNDRDLNEALKYTDPRGNAVEKPFGGMILHNFNHESFHRGMISLYLELLGRDNSFGSFTAVL